MSQSIAYATPLDAFSPNAIGVANAYDAYQNEAILVNVEGTIRELAVFEPDSNKTYCLAYDLSTPITVRNAGDSLLTDDVPSLHAEMSLINTASLMQGRINPDSIHIRILNGNAPRTFIASIQMPEIDISLTVVLTRPKGSALNGIGMDMSVSYYSTDDFTWAVGDVWPDNDRVEDRIPRTFLRKVSDAVFAKLI